jgi:hypothetical protein
MTTIATLHPIAAAAASLIQGKKDVRDYLNGIHIEPRKAGGVIVVGTDGQRLLAIADKEGTLEGKSIIVRLDPQTVTKCKQAKAGNVLELRDDGTAHIPALGHIAAYTVIDGKYPDWRAVMPKEAGDVQAGPAPAFNPLYLADLCAVGKLLANGRTPAVRLHTRGPQDCAAVSFHCTIDRLIASGCIMPVKHDDFGWGVE